MKDMRKTAAETNCSLRIFFHHKKKKIVFWKCFGLVPLICRFLSICDRQRKETGNWRKIKTTLRTWRKKQLQKHEKSWNMWQNRGLRMVWARSSRFPLVFVDFEKIRSETERALKENQRSRMEMKENSCWNIFFTILSRILHFIFSRYFLAFFNEQFWKTVWNCFWNILGILKSQRIFNLIDTIPGSATTLNYAIFRLAHSYRARTTQALIKFKHPWVSYRPWGIVAFVAVGARTPSGSLVVEVDISRLMWIGKSGTAQMQDVT
jgi:hypothetical protein